MELAFAYSASDGRRQKVNGVVLAADSDQAIYRLKRVELTDVRVSLAPFGTLRGWLNPNFNQRELSLFYRTLADRLESGLSAAESIESSAEFIRDPRLVQSVRMAALYVRASKTHEALQQGGFPAADCSLLEAVADSGETASTLIAMANRIDREVQLKRAALATLAPSFIALAIIIVFFWGFVVFMSPRFIQFFKDRNLWEQMTPWVRDVYSFSSTMASQPELFTLLYFGVAIALVGAGLSGRLAGTFRVIPGVGPLLDRWEHLRLWAAFRVMQNAGLVLPKIFRLLSSATDAPQTRESLMRAGRLAENGEPLPEIVVRVGLPDYVCRYIKAAAPGKMDQALDRLLKALDFDAQVLAGRVQIIGTMMGFAMVMGAILFAYRVTYWENFTLLRRLVS